MCRWHATPCSASSDHHTTCLCPTRYIARPISPRLYEPRSPPRIQPFGLDEYTFHPATNFRRTAAAQQRSSGDGSAMGSGAQGSRALSPGRAWPAATAQQQKLCSGAATSGPSRVVSSPGRMRSPAHDTRAPSALEAQTAATATASASEQPRPASMDGQARTALWRCISPHLDWDEFIVRQQEFLQARARRLQQRRQLEKQGQAARCVSPGSTRLLARSSIAAELATEPGAARWSAARRLCRSPPPAVGHCRPESGTCSPDRFGSLDESADAELTFRPRISKRAQCKPPRSLEEMVDGGRQKREEWREAAR